MLTPLRFLNAMYYNIWIYGLWNIRDHFADIFNPKVKGMRFRKGFLYGVYWLFGLPYRLIKYSTIGVIQFCEGIVFVFIDTVYPALTMYHGTEKTISINNISKPGKWLVGNGNYAGSGLYFTMNKRVARHYARFNSNSVIICSRVSLGRVINLSLAPNEIRNSVKFNGDRITDWGLSKGFTTAEWWRDDQKWWEYCILNRRSGKEIKTWRIRVLYIENVNDGKKERIWGGKSFWLF
ncbi:hypothetical protein [Riemerella anatipestifer]|uniref:hypothetical protein n=1 Tax=Riemerella anatipestifer TaxID=34085 RepID=UPI003DA80B42